MAGLKFRKHQLALPKNASAVAPPDVYTNQDMDPTPKKNQTWGMITWWMFWLSAVADPASWQTGSSIIPTGLTWRDAIAIVIVGNVIIAVVITLNGTIGSKLRVPFPVAVRASFGYWFSYFAIISRVVLAWFWFGIETYNGGSAVTQCLRAMWPNYSNIPNHLPESAGMTTQDFCSFFIYYVIQLPFLFINTNRLKYLFIVKCIYVPATALGTMGYLVHKAGGSGPLLSQKATVHGSDYSRAWLLSFAAICGNWATMACNAPDFTRYAKKPAAQWMQLPAIPICGFFITVCGIIGASASMIVYGGDALWSPYDIIANWDNRAAVWFASFGWIIGSIGSNISANSISAANDLTTMCPKYINIRRGQIITSIIGGWAMVPWKVLASSNTFLTFMSSYALIMGPIAAVITCDFWLVKKQKYNVIELYNPRGIYRYTGGVNWRAALNLLLTITPNLPGLINQCNSSIYVGNISWYSAPGFISGYFPSLVVYYLINRFFPDKNTLIPEAVLAEDIIRDTDEYDEEYVAEVGDKKHTV